MFLLKVCTLFPWIHLSLFVRFLSSVGLNCSTSVWLWSIDMEINRFRDLWLYEFHQDWFPVSPRICLFNLTGENHFEFHVICFMAETIQRSSNLKICRYKSKERTVWSLELTLVLVTPLLKVLLHGKAFSVIENDFVTLMCI